jgi:hypothetical protein
MAPHASAIAISIWPSLLSTLGESDLFDKLLWFDTISLYEVGSVVVRAVSEPRSQ